MKKTYIALAVASLMTIGGGVVAGEVAYTNQDLVGAGEDLTTNYDSSYDRIAYVSDGKTHTISGYNTITWTHDDAPDGNGTLFAGNKAGSKLDISANAINITTINKDQDQYPNLIHAYGATVTLNAVDNINLTISGDGGALMSQAKESGASLLKVVSSQGSISIKSDSSSVLAEALTDSIKKDKSEVILSAAKDVTLTSGKAAVYLTNAAGSWKSGQGNLSVDIHAGEKLEINGVNGLLQNVTTEGDTESGAKLTAGKEIVVNTTSHAVYLNSVTTGTNSATIAAPKISITSEKGSAVSAVKNSSISFGDGVSANEVNLTATNGSSVNVGDSDSSVSFIKSTVNATGNVSSDGKVNLTDSNFNLKDGSTFTSDMVGGSNSSITINKLPAKGSEVKSVSITTNNSTGLVVAAGSTLNDNFNSAEEAVAALKDTTSIGGDGTYSFAGQSGAISDAFTADDQGNITSRTTNQSLDAFGNYNAMTLVQWRNEVNHISQRLGDVRDSSTTIGAWARVYGYDSTYDDNVSIDFKANSIQAGGDYRINNTWLVGGAFSYTDGEGKFSNGSADSDGYSLAAYLSGFFDCGGYVDFVGRIGRLSTDITAYSDASEFKGSYNNTTFGLSAEVGYHWKLNDTFYVEPQAELAYGFVKGDDFTGANDVRVEQDDFQTLVGRLGARIGASFADGAGTVYAHASVNHDFLGDADYTASLGSVSRDLSVDIGGTWVSYGIGAQFNTSKNLNFYGTLERANGSEYQEDYRYSVGMSYRF